MDKFGTIKRTMWCGQARLSDAGREVSVCGWVQRRRDLGSLLFIDLRDRSGILQLAFDDKTDRAVFDKALTVRSEYVLAARGVIRERASKNPDLPTGEVELEVLELQVLAESETPPFEIVENSEVNDALRLKYRYLDLRRPDMARRLMLRHKIVKCARDYFDEQGFIEVETPMLTKSTPEGARDYLVPSRLHPGKFYALPQSPQQYKQLLMVAGVDRYFQIARCFRDEDLRADRQPEFTQIDLEMSFVDQEDVMAVNEGFLKRVFKTVLGVDIETPILRMPYKEAMERYGSDKPDLRFGLELRDLTDLVKDCGFKVFTDAVSAGGSVRAICVPGGAKAFPRKQIDQLTEFVKTCGAKGLAWLRLSEEGTSSSFAKFMTEDEMAAIQARCEAKMGDLVLIVADPSGKAVFTALGALRCEVARRMGLIPEGVFKLVWITEFPMFEYSEEEGRYVAVHHPFTAPLDEDFELLETAPERCRAKAYDIVLNGVEIGGGSIRINTPEVQRRMFRALQLREEDAQERFGHLLTAFKYGAPPHGGLAYGLDRLVMLLAGAESIRDVIAFPKVQNASELMTGSPDVVEPKQLTELHIAVTEDA